MVTMLNEFPGVRVTFNLVPSLMVPFDAFARRKARDPHLLIGLKPADTLDQAERAFLVANAFHAPVDRVIRPHPRYAELYTRRRQPDSLPQDVLDLQVIHKLVWMDPTWCSRDERLRPGGQGDELHRGGQGEASRRGVGAARVSGRILPAAAATGRVELSTSPFYHPILPLLCDSDVTFAPTPVQSSRRSCSRIPTMPGRSWPAFDFRLAVLVPARAGVARRKAPCRTRPCA